MRFEKSGRRQKENKGKDGQKDRQTDRQKDKKKRQTGWRIRKERMLCRKNEVKKRGMADVEIYVCPRSFKLSLRLLMVSFGI